VRCTSCERDNNYSLPYRWQAFNIKVGSSRRATAFAFCWAVLRLCHQQLSYEEYLIMNKTSSTVAPAFSFTYKSLAAAVALALPIAAQAVPAISTNGNKVLFGGQPGSVAGNSYFWSDPHH
jgi:hypothetical protein